MKNEHEDWHTAYIEIINRFLNAAKNKSQPVGLPAFPLICNLQCESLLFELGSYWEGALYFLCRVIGARIALRGLSAAEKSVADNHATFEERLFMEIWDSHGQLKWLKAHLIREGKQSLLDSINSWEEIRKVGQMHKDKELIWLSSFIEQHEDEGRKYPNPYFGGTNPLHLGGILYE